MPSASELPASTLTLKSLKDPSFDVDQVFLRALGQWHGGTDQPLPIEALQSIHGHLAGVQRRLQDVQKTATTVCERLAQDTSEKQGLLLSSLQTVERSCSEGQSLFREVEAKTACLTQAATRHGNRLKTALLEKQRASAAIRQLNHLLTFAHAPSLSALPALFHDDARAGEAAATASALLALSREVVEAMRSSHTLKQTAPLGSINAALARLEEYCNALDNRVVSRFDAALARSDFPAMAACARIMAAGAGKKGDPSGSGERLLIQRYISTRPLFTEPEQDFAGRGLLGDASPDTGSPSKANPIRSLRLLYKTLLQNIMNEAVVAEQVFTQPTAALAAFVTRVFEQRVQSAVDQTLSWQGVPDPPAASDLRAHLCLLAEAVAMTRGLASDAQEVMAGESALMNELADAATAQHLAGYLAEEMEWLDTRFREEQEGAASGQLTLPAFMDLLAVHTEALDRATSLGLGAGLGPTVRDLHGRAADLSRVEGPPCLLRQAHALLAAGLAAAGDDVRDVLGALGTLGASLELLQAHHAARVAPVLLPGPADALAVAAGLEALQAELDGAALAALDGALRAALASLEAQLAVGQLPADFRPSDRYAAPGEGPGERPTLACTRACATLTELMRLAEQHLHGPNCDSMQSEIGVRLVHVLQRHMAQYRFCPLGALCWRRDLQEYRRSVRAAGPAARQLAEMEAEVGLLVVAPGALPGLAGGTLGLSALRARAVVALRTDCGEASVSGKRLAALFPDDQRR